MIQDRHKSILEMLVREYIKTAEPVSSERVAQRLKYSISPATVRNIFAELTDDGYIEQPYISGGRIPRAQGYRFFVDQLFEGHIPETSLPQDIENMLNVFDDIHQLQTEVAEHFHVLTQFGNTMPVGFNEIFREPEFTERSLVQELGKFLDEFEDRRNDYNQLLEPESFSVFIGNENTIQPARHMSVIVGKDAKNELFFFAGSTRMPYDRIICLLKTWKKNPKQQKIKKTQR